MQKQANESFRRNDRRHEPGDSFYRQSSPLRIKQISPVVMDFSKPKENFSVDLPTEIKDTSFKNHNQSPLRLTD